MSRLKKESKDVKTSLRLLAALEALYANGQDPVVWAAAADIVMRRLGRLKTVKKTLDSNQCRDLKIILFFTDSTMLPTDVREDACAILKLYGDDVSVAEVCRVYPGLHRMFNE